MHWLGDAATRAGMKGATTLLIPDGETTAEAWEVTARALGTTPGDLASRIAPTFGLHGANFRTADAKAIRLVPEKMARKFAVFPLRDDDRRLVVATSDPRNIECEQALGFAAGRRIVFELGPPAAVLQAINAGYSSDRSAIVLANLDAELTDAVKVIDGPAPEVTYASDVEAAPVVQLTNLILRDAVRQRASDIHIEPGEGNGVVRYRIDGVMRQHMQVPMWALTRVVSRVKVLARMDIADRLRPQDGRARLQIDEQLVDMRISTVPIGNTEKVVIRVLRPEGTTTLEEVGVAPVELARLRQLLAYRDGIVLVTGPTGSGKTTTLYAALRELASGHVNIMTVEDPVEFKLPGISQIQADPKRGVTFASALRAILRQDPDVIFVGEIRDLETAEIAVQASMTGHLVLATLHTNDAVSAVARLMDLGLDKAALAATMRGALAQRLIRGVCTDCVQVVGAELTEDEVRLASLFGVRPVVRAVGCDRCAHTGYYGRMPINEVAVFTPQMTGQVTQSASTAMLQATAVAGGMRTLRQTAIERAMTSQTTLAEIERVVGDAPGGAVVGAPVAVELAESAILVVDDDPVQRLFLSTTLKNHGYRVSTASDGAEALRRLSAGEECNLVLTDLHMPELGGDELVQRLRALPHTAVLPIVVLTGSAEADLESELIDFGADDYIRKPVEPPRLLSRVKAVLRRAS